MQPALSTASGLVALGGFIGAQVLVVCLSVVIANAYRDRALMFHALAVVLAILVVGALAWPDATEAGSDAAHMPPTVMFALLSVVGWQLRELVNHMGALRQPLRWLVVTCAALPLVAALDLVMGWNLLVVGALGLTAILAIVMVRAWPQIKPWGWWVLIGLAPLLGAAFWLGLRPESTSIVAMAAALSLWAASTYIATVWRSRLLSETRLRMEARNLVDPLTGLSTPLIFMDRIEAARSLIQRYGHPSVLLMAQIENLGALAEEFGPEVAESAVLVAASRIRQSLGSGDVAARISHARIAVLAEGVSAAQGAADLGTRILVAGLKEPLPAAPTEFVQFRLVVAPLPVGDSSAKTLLQRLATQLDAQMRAPSERRIVTLTAEELLG